MKKLGAIVSKMGGVALLSILLSSVGEVAARRGGFVTIPESSVRRANDSTGVAHTNLRIMAPFESPGSLNHSFRTSATVGLPPYSGYFYETPASLACIYRLVTPVVAGCNPNSTVQVPQGGSRAIAIVDAYHYPTAQSDLLGFSNQFGLKTPNLSVVYASGFQPRVDPTGGWALEAALDIEWAHAMAPGAKIYLVEAASNSFADLFQAVTVASNLVAANGGGEVSMSWGGSEFSGEVFYDAYFRQQKVVYVASAGDSPGTEYPSVSPNVIAVGGTSTSRNPATGSFIKENAWQITGGGVSIYEPRPGYQNGVSAVVGSSRGVPDVAFDADPNTGVWVLYGGQWNIVGGTSVGAPAIAGIINAAAKFNASSAAELTQLYTLLNPSLSFQDTVAGSCGPYNGYMSSTGWDLCTGMGSPLGLTGF
jgi:kumamolisin